MSYPKSFACHYLGVGAVIINEQQEVLLVKLTYGRAQNQYLIPGGLLEAGETLEEGLIREIKEETGLDIKPKGIIGIRSMIRKINNLTDIYTIFICDILSNPTKIGTNDPEIADIKWIPISEIDGADILPYTRVIVKNVQNNRFMALDEELNSNVKQRQDISKYSQFWV
ncbi:MAG: NUDIX domain-containing protein [Candidatus Hodarchaeales archaeon]|jgi:nucleoside triphosphatase